MRLNIIHGAQKYFIDLPDLGEAQTSGDSSEWDIGRLRQEISVLTGQPCENLRLIFKGKTIANDSNSMQTLNIKDGDKMMVLSIKPLENPQFAQLKKLESTKLFKIKEQIIELDKQLDGMEKGFLGQKHFQNAGHSLEKGIKLSTEDCMRLLEEMDSMILGADGDSTAKVKRKSLVKEVQQQLDYCDGLRDRLNDVLHPT